MFALRRVACEFGIPAKSWIINPVELGRIPLPAIAFVNRDHLWSFDESSHQAFWRWMIQLWESLDGRCAHLQSYGRARPWSSTRPGLHVESIWPAPFNAEIKHRFWQPKHSSKEQTNEKT